MSGSVRAAILIGLAVVVVIAVNARLYRMVKAATMRGRVEDAQSRASDGN